jgi:hypothetical protein
VPGEFVPGSNDFGFIARDTMDEHKLSPASKPAKNYRYNYDYRDDYRGKDNYYCQMSEYAVFYRLHYRAAVAVLFPSVAAATATAAPAKLRKPCAKTNNKPL